MYKVHSKIENKRDCISSTSNIDTLNFRKSAYYKQKTNDFFE